MPRPKIVLTLANILAGGGDRGNEKLLGFFLFVCLFFCSANNSTIKAQLANLVDFPFIYLFDISLTVTLFSYK